MQAFSETIKVHRAYISAGSNLDDRKANLESGLISLAEGCSVQKVSAYFETEPVGYADQPWFLNIAVELETDLAPLQLLNLCRKIEESRGRTRLFPNAPRTLDLDILLFDALILTDEDLIIPHPRMAERRFVLEPLAQIAPDVIHPVLGKSIRSLLDECPDQSRILRK
jgi:2-amino-4-hydroxy-6-hydroxymethyldihydropteridine diphosphokinase